MGLKTDNELRHELLTEITVPEKVFFGIIRHSHRRRFLEISQGASVSDSYAAPVFQQIKLTQQANLIFVNANEKVTLRFKSAWLHVDPSEIAEDFTFIGPDRCASKVRNFKKITDIDGYSPLDKSLITSALKSVVTRLAENPTDETLYKAVHFLGCLTDEATIRSLFSANDFYDLKDILDIIQYFSKQLIEIRGVRNNSQLVAVIGTLDLMARNAVSTAIIEGYAPLCSRQPTMGRDGDNQGHVSGYISTQESLNQVAEYLHIKQTGLSPMALDLLEILARMRSLAGLSDWETDQNKLSEIEAIRARYNLFDISGRVLAAKRQFALIPKIKPDRNLKELANELDEMVFRAERVNSEFNRQLRLLARLRPPINLLLDYFESLIYKFEESEYRFKRYFLATYSLFSPENSISFGSTLGFINDRHRTSTTTLLTERFGGFLKEFVDEQTTKIIKAKAQDGVSNCVYFPLSGNNENQGRN